MLNEDQEEGIEGLTPPMPIERDLELLTSRVNLLEQNLGVINGLSDKVNQINTKIDRLTNDKVNLEKVNLEKVNPSKIEEVNQNNSEDLTEKQANVLRLVKEGLTNIEISREIGVSLPMVNKYKKLLGGKGLI